MNPVEIGEWQLIPSWLMTNILELATFGNLDDISLWMALNEALANQLCCWVYEKNIKECKLVKTAVDLAFYRNKRDKRSRRHHSNVNAIVKINPQQGVSATHMKKSSQNFFMTFLWLFQD